MSDWKERARGERTQGLALAPITGGTRSSAQGFSWSSDLFFGQ